MKDFFKSFIDGTSNLFNQDGSSNVDHVRFDEWLIHHLLGIDYYRSAQGYPDPTHPMYTPGQTDAPSPDSYYSTLAQALTILDITVATDADVAAGLATHLSEVLDTPGNREKILPWLMLYTAQAGNRLSDTDEGVSFKRWIENYLYVNPDIEMALGLTFDEVNQMTANEFADCLRTRIPTTLIYDWFLDFGFDQGSGGGLVI